MKCMLTLVVCFACFYACAQSTSTDKKANTLKPQLSVAPPFVLYGSFSDEGLLKRLRDSLFKTKVTPADYKRRNNYESDVNKMVTLIYEKYLRKHFQLNYSKISNQDSMEIGNALASNTNWQYVLSAEGPPAPVWLTQNLTTYLKKDTPVLITSVVDYFLYGAYGPHRIKPVAFTLFQIFVIDDQYRLLYYHRRVFTWLGGPGGVIRMNIKKGLKGYVKSRKRL